MSTNFKPSVVSHNTPSKSVETKAIAALAGLLGRVVGREIIHLKASSATKKGANSAKT